MNRKKAKPLQAGLLCLKALGCSKFGYFESRFVDGKQAQALQFGVFVYLNEGSFEVFFSLCFLFFFVLYPGFFAYGSNVGGKAFLDFCFLHYAFFSGAFECQRAQCRRRRSL